MADYDVKAVLSAVDQGFTASLNKAGEVLKGLGDKAGKVKQAFSGAVGGITSKVGDVKNNVGDFAQKTGTAMTVAGAGMTAFGMNQLKSFGDFQSSLNQAAVIAGGTSKDIDGLSKVANKMGADLPLSAKQCSDAMVGMAKNGASIDDIKKEFPAIAKASTAAGSDISATADAVMQSMNIWGGDASKNAAILVQTANQSNASVDSMGQAFSNVGSTAKMLHMPLSTTAEAIGLLTNHGESSAQASQDLNHALLAMMNPSSKAKDVMNQLGITYTDAHGKMLPFRTILGELSNKLADLSPKQRASAEATMFGTSGMKAMEPLIQSITAKAGDASNNWDAYAKKQEQAAGSTSRAGKTLNNQAKDMQNNLGSALEQVGGNWDSLKNTAIQASSGMYKKIAGDISGFEDKLTKANTPLSKFVLNFIGLIPVLGPSLTAIGSLTTIIGGLMQMNPAVLLIGALGTALGIIVAKSPQAKNGIKQFVKSFNDGGLLKDAQKTIKQIMDGIGRMIGTMAKDTNIKGFFNGLKTLFTAIFDAINQIIGTIPGLGDSLQKNGKKGDAWTAIGKAFADIFNNIGRISKDIGKMITNMLKSKPAQQLFESIHNAFKGIFKFIQSIMHVIGQFIKAFTQGKEARRLWGAISNIFKSIFDFIGQITNNFGKMIGSFDQSKNANKTVGALASVFQAIETVIHWIIQNASKMISALTQGKQAQGIWKTVSDIFNDIVNFIKYIADNISGMFKQFDGANHATAVIKPISTILKFIKDRIKYGIKNMKTFFDAFSKGDRAKHIWQSISDIFKNIWTIINNIFKFLDTLYRKFAGAKEATYFWKGFGDELGDILNFIFKLIDAVTKFFAAITDIKKIEQAFKQIGQWLNGLQRSFDNASQQFQDWFINLGKWIQNQWNGFKRWLGQVFDPKNWLNLGKNAVLGIIQGISNTLRLIPGVGNDIANKLVDSTKSALGIHSPSRVMRDQIGYNVMRGITSGMSDNEDMLTDVSQSTSNTLIGTLRDQINGVNGLKVPLNEVIQGFSELRTAIRSSEIAVPLFSAMTSSISATTKAMMELNNQMLKNRSLVGQSRNIGGMMTDSINDAYDQVHTINFDNGDQVVDQNITLDQSDRPANINLTLGGQDFRAYIHNLGLATEAEARLRRVRGY